MGEGEIESSAGDTQFYYRTMPPSNVILEGRREGVRLAKEWVWLGSGT